MSDERIALNDVVALLELLPPRPSFLLLPLVVALVVVLLCLERCLLRLLLLRLIIRCVSLKRSRRAKVICKISASRPAILKERNAKAWVRLRLKVQLCRLFEIKISPAMAPRPVFALPVVVYVGRRSPH